MHYYAVGLSVNPGNLHGTGNRRSLCHKLSQLYPTSKVYLFVSISRDGPSLHTLRKRVQTFPNILHKCSSLNLTKKGHNCFREKCASYWPNSLAVCVWRNSAECLISFQYPSSYSPSPTSAENVRVKKEL
jgi:hypothetical protein